MRLNPARIIGAPKARNIKARGGRDRESGLWNLEVRNRIEVERSRGGISALCRPSQGLFILIVPTQGSGRVSCAALPALLTLA